MSHFIRFPTAFGEMILAWITICWGLVLILPYDALAGTKTGMALTDLAPEFLWGLLAMVIGLVKFGFSYMGKWIRPMAIIGAVYWSSIATLYAMENLTAPALGMFVALATANLAVILFTEVD